MFDRTDRFEQQLRQFLAFPDTRTAKNAFHLIRLSERSGQEQRALEAVNTGLTPKRVNRLDFWAILKEYHKHGVTPSPRVIFSTHRKRKRWVDLNWVELSISLLKRRGKTIWLHATRRDEDGAFFTLRSSQGRWKVRPLKEALKQYKNTERELEALILEKMNQVHF